MTRLGLDPNRISSLDEYGHHLTVIPAEVRGFYRRRRNLVQALLILFFLILPWTKINGSQSVLLNIAERKFAIFGIVFYAHDVPLIFFVLASLVMGLALLTAVWGRVWCGWACPQTVFIDGIYRRLEIWIEGSYLQRRALEAAPFSWEKLRKRSLKWIAFFIVSSLFAHSFAAYFIGSQRLIAMLTDSPREHWGTFLVVSGFTLLLLFDFGWFREQFCLIMCPYGRFQSVLLDSSSMTVTYNEARGEPRKGQTLPGQARGDCVACGRCVQACPTGIDIRKGLQMECIACTACMDACDEIMTKVQKPKGLIRYANGDGGTWVFRKPRALIYSLLLCLSLGGLASQVVLRDDLHWALLRNPGELYQVLSSESQDANLVQNHLRLHIRNQSSETQTLRMEVRSPEGEIFDLITPQNPLKLEPGEDRSLPLFVRFPIQTLNAKGQTPARLLLHELSASGKTYQQETQLLGPAHEP